MSSTPFQPDLLSLISCDSCAEGATSVSGHAEPVSGHKESKRRQCKSLTDRQLLDARKEVDEEYGFAQEAYLTCSRYQKSSFRREMREAGCELRRILEEMKVRGILYDPTGKWNRPTGRKGDHAR